MFGQWIADKLTGGLLSTITDLGKALINKEISEEEFHSKVAESMFKASVEIDGSIMEAGANTFASAQSTLRTTKVVQYCYAAVVVVTLWSLFWFTWIQPFGVAMAGCDPTDSRIFVDCSFPVLKTGDKILEWNYLILAGLFGLAPFVLRDHSKGLMESGMEWVKKRFKD